MSGAAAGAGAPAVDEARALRVPEVGAEVVFDLVGVGMTPVAIAMVLLVSAGRVAAGVVLLLAGAAGVVLVLVRRRTFGAGAGAGAAGVGLLLEEDPPAGLYHELMTGGGQLSRRRNF